MGEPGERLVGRPLHDSAGRFLGEITCAVLGERSGQLQTLLVTRGQGEPVQIPAQRLIWEDDHWAVVDEPRSAEPPPLPAHAYTLVPAQDWMVGQIATRRLTDRRGQVIVEAGQRITPGTVELASRASVLHRLA